MATSRKLKTRQDVVSSFYQDINQSAMNALDTIVGAFHEKDQREREMKFRSKAANVDTIRDVMPHVLLKKEYQDWATDDGVYDNLLGYVDDMKNALDAGKNFVPEGSFLGFEADESINFGIDPTIKVTEEDVSTYRSWLFGTGRAADAYGIEGVVNKTDSELTHAEKMDLVQKGILRVDQSSSTGYESWDNVRDNATLISDRFDMFVTGFKAADKGDRYFTDEEMIVVENQMISNQQSTVNLIKSDPKYIRASNAVTSFDGGALETTLGGIDKSGNHNGYSFYSDREGKQVRIKDGKTTTENIQALVEEGYTSLAYVLQSDIATIASDPKSGMILEGLKGESEAVYENVKNAIEAYQVRESYESQIDISSLDVFSTQEKRAQLADINLLIAEKVNFEIDSFFESMANDPDSWRDKFDSQVDFESNSLGMQKLFKEVNMLANRLTNPLTPEYNETAAAFIHSVGGSDPNDPQAIPNLESWLHTLLVNRSQKEGLEHYFMPLDPGQKSIYSQ
jgi:hypothetical protein